MGFLRPFRFLILILAIVTFGHNSYAELYSGCSGPSDSNFSYNGNTIYACNAGSEWLDTTTSGITLLNNYASPAYVCPNSGVSSATRAVGWSDSCKTPAGAVGPDATTCITVPNLIGEVIDIVTTVGIGIDMFQNFCSANPGSPVMEGGLISQSFFDQTCTNITYPSSGGSIAAAQKQCQSQLLRGYSANNVAYGSGDLDHYVTNNLCDAAINLERPVIDSDGKYVFNGNQQVFCPLMRCNIPTNTMISMYYDRVGARTAIMAAFGGVIGALVSELAGNCLDIVELGNGDSASVALFDIIQLQGQTQGDMICTEMLFPTGYTTVACKPLPIPVTNYPGTTNCLIANTSCANGQTHSQSFFPVTARMMECVQDLVSELFTSQGNACPQSALAIFQDGLRSVVQILLVLYVILFGLKIVMGGKVPGKSEFFTFILKFALVVYFAVGTLNPSPSNDNSSQSGLDYIYQVANSAMNSFSGIIIGSSPTNNSTSDTANFCQYSNYASDDYAYLALWDSLDCRLAFYLGIASPVAGGAVQAMTSNLLNAGMFILIWSMLFSFYFPLFVFMICFGIFLLSVIVYFVHVYILALFAIALLIFVGPIFIPLALFDRTKGYFDQWFQLIMAYALYPVVITAFISIMIVSYDQLIYSDCTFSLQNTYGLSYWVFDSPLATCKDSFGYILAQLTSGTASEVIDFAGGLFNFTRLEQGATILIQLLEAMMTCTFLAYLFYYFSKELSHFAADITGATNLGGHAISPTAVADAAASAYGELNKKDDIPKDKGGDDVNVSKEKDRDGGVGVSTKNDDQDGASVSADKKLEGSDSSSGSGNNGNGSGSNGNDPGVADDGGIDVSEDDDG